MERFFLFPIFEETICDLQLYFPNESSIDGWCGIGFHIVSYRRRRMTQKNLLSCHLTGYVSSSPPRNICNANINIQIIYQKYLLALRMRVTDE